ncbi:MAG: hypothetical protein QM754_00300 [Tepidisphaeraceae bacterium]
MLKFATRAALVAAALLVPVSSSFGYVLFDSYGFETSAGYTANNYLQGQSTTAVPTDRWVQSPNYAAGAGTAVPYAAVYAYASPAAPNYQYALVGDLNVPADNANFFNPGTNIFNPYTPAVNQAVAVTWTMQTLSSGVANNPFFGISVYSSAGEVATIGVNASTGGLVSSTPLTTVSAFTAAADTTYNYELLLNYGTQTFSLYTAPAGSSSYTLRSTGSFASAATDFTDADIASFSANPGAGLAYSGYAVFDYYKVETVAVPEPTMIGIAGAAFGLLGARRRTRSA